MKTGSRVNEASGLTTIACPLTTRVKTLTELKFGMHLLSSAGDWSIRRQGICPMRSSQNSWAVRIDESTQKVFTTKTFC